MSIKLGDKTLAGVSEMDNLPAERVTATDPQSLGFTNTQGFIDVASEKLVGLEDNFLTANKTVYVDATNGDDTTGDGSQAKPWKTIQKAVDMCPICTAGRYEYRILLKPGTYDYGGNLYNLSTNITITGEDYSSIDKVDNTLIKGMINVNNCRMVTLQGLKIQNNDNAGVAVGGDSNIVMYYCKLDKCRINVDNGRLAASRCDISNYGHASLGAIHCQGGIINLSVITGTGNNIAMSCGVNGGDGGVIYAGVNCSISGKKITNYGGRIEFGSQGWQFIGSVTGANSVAIDSELYTEFLVFQSVSGVRLQYYINSSYMSSNESEIRNGNYEDSTECLGARISFTKTYIKNLKFYYKGIDNTDKSGIIVYGKR